MADDFEQQQWRRELIVTSAGLLIGTAVMASTFTWEPPSWRVIPRICVGLSLTSLVIRFLVRWRERRRNEDRTAIQ